MGIYKPAVQRKSNEADRQENDKSTSHITSLPANNKNCIQDTINRYLACHICDFVAYRASGYLSSLQSAKSLAASPVVNFLSALS